ncbi:hypothetical protein B0H66DRAFT_534969 [Apodospora peruviana]|uniref:Uncharacterized protein n=1 Tax=Apodospora peruviana TaxID=516989 RepID=A0AAE0I1H0_9PEZI|nr:hypothetical protein B0H66DRAFT_534969 [Apodospora peruviana]
MRWEVNYKGLNGSRPQTQTAADLGLAHAHASVSTPPPDSMHTSGGEMVGGERQKAFRRARTLGSSEPGPLSDGCRLRMCFTVLGGLVKMGNLKDVGVVAALACKCLARPVMVTVGEGQGGEVTGGTGPSAVRQGHAIPQCGYRLCNLSNTCANTRSAGGRTGAPGTGTCTSDMDDARHQDAPDRGAMSSCERVPGSPGLISKSSSSSRRCLTRSILQNFRIPSIARARVSLPTPPVSLQVPHPPPFRPSAGRVVCVTRTELPYLPGTDLGCIHTVIRTKYILTLGLAGTFLLPAGYLTRRTTLGLSILIPSFHLILNTPGHKDQSHHRVASSTPFHH